MFSVLDDAFKGKKIQPFRQSLNALKTRTLQKGKTLKLGDSGVKSTVAAASPDKGANRRPSFYDQSKLNPAFISYRTRAIDEKA